MNLFKSRTFTRLLRAEKNIYFTAGRVRSERNSKNNVESCLLEQQVISKNKNHAITVLLYLKDIGIR